MSPVQDLGSDPSLPRQDFMGRSWHGNEPEAGHSLDPKDDSSQDKEPRASQIYGVVCGKPEPAPFPQGFPQGFPQEFPQRFPQGFPKAELLAALPDFLALLFQREVQPPSPGPIHNSRGKSMARHPLPHSRGNPGSWNGRNSLAPSKGGFLPGLG